MPLDLSEFPEEVQVAFFIFSYLPDKWDTNVGYYMGKDWTLIPFLFETFGVQDKAEILYFMKSYENLLVSYRAKESESKRKAAEKKSSATGGGKQFAHNVKG